uniref:uncharacterized protein LOC105350375 n=1 Tax=Fragaria vesca subsp. vesca TaxID=101020 RepID=UPI0005CA4476|nr:PREDICTED: uncharacterized protein LOC105350375 [Fragaria vesca subsp. vesca]
MPPRRRTQRAPHVGDDMSAQEGMLGAFEQIVNQFAAIMNPQPPPDFSIKKTKENGAEKFSTAKDPIEAHEWIETMERVFTRMSVPEDRKVFVAVQWLHGPAWHWWVGITRDYGDAPHMTWDEFKFHFNDRYCSRAHLHRMQDQFMNLQKGDMSVLEFEQHFFARAHHVPDLVRDEHDKIYRFVRGLGGEYEEKMQVVLYPRFSDAVGAALNIETSQMGSRPRDFGGPSQGPSKRAASTSGSGSSAGSGRSSSSGHSARPRLRDNRRFAGGSAGRRPFSQFRGGSSSGDHSSQSSQSGHFVPVWLRGSRLHFIRLQIRL